MLIHANVKQNQGKIKFTSTDKALRINVPLTYEQENSAEKHWASFPSNEPNLFHLPNKQSLWASEATGADGAAVSASTTKPACLRGCEAGWRISCSICQRGRTHRLTVSSMSNDSLQMSHLLSYFLPRHSYILEVARLGNASHNSVLWLNNQVPAETETINSMKKNLLE